MYILEKTWRNVIYTSSIHTSSFTQDYMGLQGEGRITLWTRHLMGHIKTKNIHTQTHTYG